MSSNQVSIKLKQITDNIRSVNLNDVVAPGKDDVSTCMNQTMGERLLGKTIMEIGKEKYDKAGENLEKLAILMGYNTNVPTGQPVVIHNNGQLSFTKKVNRPAKSVDTKKLTNVLLRMGVSSELLEAALAEATVEKKPATYMTVDLVLQAPLN